MKISATIKSSAAGLETSVQTNGSEQKINIQAKASGLGSSVNGGELLLLSLATCFCNDIFREAEKLNIKVNAVEVVASGEFGGVGEPGSNFRYKTKLSADATHEEIDRLLAHTDKIAEIHNTLRKGVEVLVSNE
jgi:uncharacterized OsmC-like protein